MKILAIFLVLLSGWLVHAVDPSSVRIKVYKIAVSKNTNCSDLVTVYTNDSPDYAEMTSSPTFASQVKIDSPGVYKCIVMDISDSIKFTPASASGSCASGTEYTINVCNNGSPSYQRIDGTTGTCSSGEDRVAVWISTASTATTGGEGSNCFIPPTSESDSSRGFNLSGGGLDLSGRVTSEFGANFDGKIDGSGGSCDLQPPKFFARKL